MKRKWRSREIVRIRTMMCVCVCVYVLLQAREVEKVREVLRPVLRSHRRNVWLGDHLVGTAFHHGIAARTGSRHLHAELTERCTIHLPARVERCSFRLLGLFARSTSRLLAHAGQCSFHPRARAGRCKIRRLERVEQCRSRHRGHEPF